MKERKIKIFLTGGEGFIGKNILEILEDKYTFIYPNKDELDLRDRNKVYDFLEIERPDIIIHTANIGGMRGEECNLSDNLRMFFNLINCKKFYKKMIFLGSGEEYDRAKPIINVKEDSIVGIPNSEYGFYKYICSKYAEKVNFINYLRIFGVYGKYEDSSRFIPSVLNSDDIIIKQNALFSYIYVNDLVRIIELFINKKPKHKIYNISSGERRSSLLDISKNILEVCNKNVPVIIKGEGNEYTCDISRLTNEFPKFRFTNFNQSIKELVNYYE
jgi:nucleoside-diphosphate-sugar epimerase